MNRSSMETCGACGGKTTRIGEKYDTSIHLCKVCGSLIANCEQPKEDFYEQDYVGGGVYGYKDSAKATTNIKPFDTTTTRRIAALRATQKIIEIGAGNGSFVRAASELGLDITGVERSHHMRKLATEVFGVELLACVPSIQSETVSLVLIEVIEHIKDPSAFLTSIFIDLGRQPEQILLTTPNGAAGQLLGMTWSQIKPPEHIILFTSDGMKNLLKPFGYEKIKIHYYHSVFLAYSLKIFGSQSNRKVPLLWSLSSLLRLMDSIICRLLPARYSTGLECFCEK